MQFSHTEKLNRQLNKTLSIYDNLFLTEFFKAIMKANDMFDKIDFDDPKLIKKLIKIQNTIPKLYFDLSKIIDKFLPPFTDNIMKRNISIIKHVISIIILDREFNYND